MAVINTKGVSVYLSKTETTPHVIDGADITSISNEKPAAVTLAVADPAVVQGDLAYTTDVNVALDDKLFVTDNIAAAVFDLLGSDLSLEGAPLTGIASVNAITTIPADDMVLLCLPQMEFGADTVNQIAVGTYCDPAATIPGTATPGTITLGGYAEVDDEGVAEVQKAAEDQQSRFFKVVLPGDNGYIVGEIALAGFSLGVPLEGAVTWTVSGTQVKKIRWVY